MIDNRGMIWGSSNGVSIGAASGTSTVMNSGTIEATIMGIQHNNADGLVVSNSGLIQSPVHAIFGSSGVEQIINSGRIIGTVSLFTGNDVYSGGAGRLAGKVLAGEGVDTIIGGADNDWFEGGPDNDALTGNAGNDVLIGETGNDTLNGGLGNDNLSGGANNDKLLGGAGVDTLTGGANIDIFVFNTALNAATNRDIVTDFFAPQDTFQLENAIFTKLGAGVHVLNPAFFRAGTAAADTNDYIVYNRATGMLSYDNDGNGAHAAIAFAVVTNKPLLTANDFQVI